MLDDVFVLQVGTTDAASQCTRILADFDARVARIEPAGGDPRRESEPGYSLFLHGRKQSIVAPDEETLARWVSRADVVVTDDDAAGHVVDRVAAGRDDIVVVRISDYGRGAAWDRPTSPFVLEAESGLMAVRDTGDRPPVATTTDLSETTAGLCAAVGALSAILHRDRTGRGNEVDVSRLEALIAHAGYPWLPHQIEGHLPDPIPSRFIATVQPAKDGWVCVPVVSQLHWEIFVEMADLQELRDPRYATLSQRFAHADELTELIGGYTRQFTIAELMDTSEQHRASLVPVVEPADVPRSLPFRSRGTYVEAPVDTPDGPATALIPRPAYRFGHLPDWAPGVLADVDDHDQDLSSREPAPRSTAGGSAAGFRPLAGMRVVQFGLFQAGPLAASYLTYLGADVIKVESVRRPDPIRFSMVDPQLPRFWDRQSLFNQCNMGARGITAELSDARGVEVLRRLVASADVVIDNYSPRVLDRLGLDAAGMQALNPGVIVVRMPAWGLRSPWRDRPGTTFTADSTSGVAAMTGYADGPPVLTGSAIDPMSAFTTASAVLAALRRRDRTGRATTIEVALCDAATPLSARAVIAGSLGAEPGRLGNRREGLVVQDTFATGSGDWLAVTIPDRETWISLAALGIRVDREPYAELAAWCAAHSSPVVLEELQRSGWRRLWWEGTPRSSSIRRCRRASVCSP
ncbi:CaiB/BaiF CoA-transferase family protein [Nocardioides humi]|uniref:CaiB/BaiF CoA-transferase family protein n=1 Tax=Nocardioides humi TaxID=449461 RepID=UPI00112AF186|nr:CoA transferase [Nocardioides humi]